MRSIKRGRGPSLFGGIMALIMSIVPIVMALSASESGFSEFQLVAVLIGVLMAAAGAFSIYSATRKQRFSEYDITDEGEEPDPLNSYFGGDAGRTVSAPASAAQGGAFCPYCGARVEAGYEFCAACGRKLPANPIE